MALQASILVEVVDMETTLALVAVVAAGGLAGVAVRLVRWLVQRRRWRRWHERDATETRAQRDEFADRIAQQALQDASTEDERRPAWDRR